MTLLNLSCGCIAVFYALEGQFEATALFVCLGIFFDFFDGLAARALHVQSDLGLQLDSLADMVTSGLVPGVVMCKLLDMALVSSGHVDAWSVEPSFAVLPVHPLALLGLLITLGSAYRLAHFNIDAEQQSYFKGLPTPANALMIISLPLILNAGGSSVATQVLLNPWILMVLTVLSCYLLNSKMKLFALKFKSWDWKSNTLRYGFLILTVLLLLALQLVAIPMIILLYFLVSLFNQKHIH